MPALPGKPTANISKASVKKSTSFDLVASGDNCFLCGRTIGESAPIGFYQGKNAMMRCHRGCIDIMEMNGGTPKDFHAFMEAKRVAPRHDKPVHQDVEAEKAQVYTEPAPEWVGPRSIKFDDFADLQAFIAARGVIPSHVRVAIGAYVLQAGG